MSAQSAFVARNHVVNSGTISDMVRVFVMCVRCGRVPLGWLVCEIRWYRVSVIVRVKAREKKEVNGGGVLLCIQATDVLS